MKRFNTVFLTIAVMLLLQQGWCTPAEVYADSAGPNSPAVASGTNWMTPANVSSQDTAFVSFSNTSQNWLIINGYGFTIPTNATITGITATIWGYGTSPTATRRQIKATLTIDGSATYGNAKTAIQLATTNGAITQGGAADVWGATLTPTDINSANFGIMIADNDTNNNAILIDSVALTVSYTVPDSTQPAVTAFEATTPANSLNIPITSFSASDNIGVTGYMITNSATAPNAGDSGWLGTIPATYTVSGDGTYTLYPWAKDQAGNVSTSYGTPQEVIVDTVPPTAELTYSAIGPYKAGTTVTITATFSEEIAAAPVPKITISGASTIAATDMTRSSATVYTYSHTVGAGNGIATVILSNGTDLAGNSLTATPTSGATFMVDNSAPTAAISYSSSEPYKTGTTVTITAIFNEEIADAPVPQIAISGANTLAAVNMVKSSATEYTYTLTVEEGNGSAFITLSTGTDLVGNTVAAIPTSGAAFIVDNIAPEISAVSPAHDSFTNNATVSFTLNEAVANGSVTFTQTGGSADPLSPQIYTLVAGDLNAGSHSVNTGKALVNGAQYTVSFAASDAAGNAATLVNSPNVFYDTTVTTVTLLNPVSGSRTNNVSVDYSLNEAISFGQIVYFWTGGTADAGSPHSYDLSGAQLTAGDHIAVNTGLTLVDGAIYSVSVTNVLDLAWNDADTVENTNVIFDSTAVAITNATPAAGSAIRTAVVNYTLSEEAATGGITFTRTGGALDPASPQSFSLAGGNLSAGVHTGVETGLTLVDGAIYTVSFNATDIAGNPSTTISNALVIFDTTAPDDGILTAIPASTSQINLSWTVALDSGSGLATTGSYKIVRTDGTTAPADCTTGTPVYFGNDTSYNDIGLTEITNYAYRLCASDASGNVSSGTTATARSNDGTAPSITAFTMPSTATSLLVAVNSFAANDNVAVTGYLITESATAPVDGDPRWNGTVPSSYTFSASGTQTAYAWAKDASGNVSMSMNATVSITTSSTLTITTAGSGKGTVNSDPGGIACESGISTDCSKSFANGIPITLTAAPDWKSDFINWTVGCIGTELSCELSLDGDAGVTATFNYKPLVMLPGPLYYATIEDSYIAAGVTELIKMRDQTFSEGIILNQEKAITLDGGYDVTWAQTGYTSLSGSLTIMAGSATINNLIIQ